MILCVQTLKMLCNPGRAVQILQLPCAIESVWAQWIGKLSQIIVQQQWKTIADVGKRGIVRRRRIRHSELPNKAPGPEQLSSQGPIVKAPDGYSALSHRRHRLRQP